MLSAGVARTLRVMPDRAGLVILMLLAGIVGTSAQTTVEKPGAAPKPAAAEHQATPAGWAVNCADGGQGLVCKASQSIVLTGTRQLLLSVSVSKPAADTFAPMLVQLPHGLFLPAGMTFSVDDAPPEKLEIQTCDAQGCYAGVGLAPDKIAAMGKGTNLNVTFNDLKKQKIVVPVPLKGFEAAFKKL